MFCQASRAAGPVATPDSRGRALRRRMFRRRRTARRVPSVVHHVPERLRRLERGRRRGRYRHRLAGARVREVWIESLRVALNCAGKDSGAAQRARLSLPRRRWGAECGKRVVTGAKIGLRASRGKDRANRKARATMSSSTPKLLAKDVSASEPWSAFRLRRARAVRRVCGLAPRPPVRLQSNATVATINAMTTAMRTPIPAHSLRRRRFFRFFRFFRFSCSWLRGRAKSSSVMSASAAQTL